MEKFEIPKGVQKAAKKGLELRQQYRRGGTEVGEETARKLSQGKSLSADEIRHIAEYFPRHQEDNLEQDGSDGKAPSNGYIAWMLWGGDEGRQWSESLRERLKKTEP